MEKYLISLFLLSVLAIGTQCMSCPGCPGSLTDEELKSEKFQNYASQGVTKIYQTKLAQNSLPSCVALDGTIQSGTKQIVAGVKYLLKIEVNPILSKSSECAGANADLSAVATEICEINIWEKPYQDIPENEKIEITFTCPAPA